jgi:hypothetical protein
MGTIPEVFRRRGHEVYATDLVDRGYPNLAGTIDFLQFQHDDPVGSGMPRVGAPYNIVCNPPFDKSVEFVVRALTLPGTVPRIHKVAIIQQLRFLGSKARFELFQRYTPTDVLVLSRRPSMPPGAQLEQMMADGSAFRGGAIDYAWFVWNSDCLRGPTQLRWLYPPKD